MTTLIIESAAIMREVLKKMFEGTSIQVVGEVQDLEGAVEFLSENKPEIILFETALATIGLNESIEKLIEASSDSKIVLCVPTIDREVAMDGIYYGAKDFIFKPYKKSMVIKTILGLSNK